MADFDLTQSGQEIQDILNGAAMQTDLTAETERAEQTEQQLQSNIDIEETRAKAAEKQNADDIDVIKGKIPAAASSGNQLVDKAFVNSSIATATATYRGAYNLVSDLHLAIDATEQQIAATLAGAISTADNNDYCFVQIPTADATSTQIAAIERYKFNGTAWAYEYTLNNSGFTADQWAALNSGITTGLVAKLAALPTNDELTLLLGGKQDVLTFDNVPTEGSNNPVKSGGVKSAIDSEKERAQGAEQANAGNIAQVIAMIPAAASSENQLTDKNFVNSSISTNTATYRGAYNEVSDLSLTVDATHEQIAAALAGAISTAENNDYCFVQVPTDDATPTQIAAIERYKFNGTAWAYEYTLNNSGFTADQWAAVNSGITSGLVAKLAALPTNDDLVAALAGKQPILTFDNVPTEDSNNPVKSGGVYAAIAEEAGTRAAAIAAIVALIPSAASALNQLADKAFVNSSISTATAVFKGTFNVVADLELNYNASQAQIALMLGSKIASADNNDYCFVQIPTSNETPLEIARTDRYKYNGTTWAYEYTLNNSGFTAAQWAAINSGITSLLKDKLIDLPTATELTTQLAAKQNVLTFDTTPTEGSTNPVTSDGIHAAINVEKERAEVAEETLQNNIDQERARALAAEQGLLDEYNELYALYQTIQGGAIIPVAAADWPVSNPQQNVIYRVANSATPTAYSDYMYNGTNTILLADFTFPGIDSEPTPDSTNLVTSGGTFDAIMQNGTAFDLSAYNAVGDTLATYEDLSAALTALNALPAAYKKGGMSMKFVQTSDNKYVQARCMAQNFTTDTTQWTIADEGVYVENPEFVYVNIDAKGKILRAIKADGSIYYGAGVPPQVIEYINSKINELSLDEYEDIVTFLGNLIEGDTLAKLLSTKANVTDVNSALDNKVDKVIGNGLIQNEVSESLSVKESPEFLNVETDKDDRLLSGRDTEGILHEYVGIDTPKVESVHIESDTATFNSAISNNIELSDAGLSNLKKDLNISYTDVIEIAKGKIHTVSSEVSELEASPIIDDSDKAFVDFVTTIKDNHYKSIGNDIVACNHDDLNYSDFVGTRKIYNKYGFKSSFCLVTSAFKSYKDAKDKIENIRKLLNDGHEVGLHALLGTSYWRTNKLYDCRPDGSSTFAPNRNELRGDNPDGTGVNAFGITITSETESKDLFEGLSYNKNVKVASDAFTDAVVNTATQEYVLYTDIVTRDGIDDTIIENILKPFEAPTIYRKKLWWLERWYNAFIDDSLGYSSSSNNVAERFADDYDIPTGASASDYYPDAAHLLNGKMVYWNDTSNSHYSEALVSTDANFNDNSYQLVGKFKKGLFKDCFSCCNYEVIDRCIETLQAFCRKYYGLNHFTDAHRHGEKDIVALRWVDSNGIKCLNREKTLVDTSCVPLYLSRLGAFCREYDILKEYGIRTLKEDQQRNDIALEGQLGLYFGQKGIRNDRSNITRSSYYGTVDFMATFGHTNNGMENLPYSDYAAFLEGIDNRFKFIYENADKTITRNGVTLNVYHYIRLWVKSILSAKGTGKIPSFTTDTIVNAPQIMLAVELMCKFCKDNGYEMMSLESAQEKALSVERNTIGNLFPNYSFEQTLLRYFGGYSNQEDVYLPDGWMEVNNTRCSFSVRNKEFEIYTITGRYDKKVRTRIYGLPSGTYQLNYSIYSSDAAGSSYVKVKSIKNGDAFGEGTLIENTECVQNEYISKSITINISSPHRNILDVTDSINTVCDGYEDNVCCIEFMVNAYTNIKLKNVSLIKV